VHVAEPGIELGTPAPGSAGGGRLLCVAAFTPGKGHDVLLRALERVADLAWQCCCVGSLGRDPEHADRMRALARDAGISDRVELVGPRTGDALDEAYAAADLLVLASRFETFGMVVTEALGHGVPVLTSAVGGLPGTLGRLPDGRRPGLLVPPGDPAALARALRRWLGERELRDSLREAARARRTTLTGWDRTTQQVAGVLEGLAA
jgi:glycosyltransferase involved in cell wall biosynthesis